MFARFGLPMLPPLLIALDRFLEEKLETFRYHLSSFLLFSCMFLGPYPPGLDEQNGTEFGISGITEERTWYPQYWEDEAKRQGEVLQHYLQGTDLKIVIYGTQAMLAYYGRVPYALEGVVGLTDKELARMPLKGNRAGHGLKSSTPYLQKRGIDLYVDFRIERGGSRFSAIDFGNGVKGNIICYRTTTMAELQKRGAVFFDFPTFLDGYIENMAQRKRTEVERDYQVFHGYYFMHNEDEERLAPFIGMGLPAAPR